MRSRLYQQPVPRDDCSLKKISQEKTNRAEADWSPTVRQINGVFHVENGIDGGISAEQMGKAREVFLELLPPTLGPVSGSTRGIGAGRCRSLCRFLSDAEDAG